jgi:exopolysaccharide production protein ExoQ
MPPPLALLITIVFSGFMLWRDAHRAPAVSPALWLPVIWIFIISSRAVSSWLGILGLPVGGAVSLEDGSPLDAVVFLLLIATGVLVLIRRQFSPTAFMTANIALTVFLVYCALAITWSDFPFVAFKRWIKTLGQPVMVLIILTEPDRAEALRRVMKRAALVLMPLSILFIKYYPELGRAFDSWTGLPENRGVALTKNTLGYMCLVFGLFFFWNLLVARRFEDSRRRREEIGITLFCLWMTWWLVSASNSATALVCLIIGISTIAILGSPFVSRRYFGTYVIAALLLAGVAEAGFGIYDLTIRALGRDPTLTTRTEMWPDLLSVPINPLLGAGFESFWLGERLDFIWSRWDFRPNQAHNGYLETYLNLGWVGVALLLIMLFATYRKIGRTLLTDFDFGRFKMGVLFAVIAYNYTEAAFRGLHPIWTMFFLISIDYVSQSARQEAHVAAPQERPSAMFKPTGRGGSGDRARPASGHEPPSPVIGVPNLNPAWRGPARPVVKRSARAHS